MMAQDTQAFAGLAELYSQYRPAYPETLWNVLRDLIAVEAAAAAGSPVTVIDVGAGTGISTRPLRQHLGSIPRIVGVEPGADMRRQARADTPPALDIEYVDGCAEALPFADSQVHAVLAAQAAQWFDRRAFYAEARRVLHAGGIVVLLENNRSWQRSGLLAAYETFLEAASPGYRRDYRAHDYCVELDATGGFNVGAPVVVDWARRLPLDAFVGMTLSSTKMQGAVRALGIATATAAAALGIFGVVYLLISATFTDQGRKLAARLPGLRRVL
jgi:SAM-dependent methyltransferase